MHPADFETAGTGGGDANSSFGHAMRNKHFFFAPSYRPLNHGSFGVFPRMVQEYQQRLQLESEARPDTFIRYTYPALLKEARASIAPLLGASTDEVVFVQNATSGVNTVLGNLIFKPGDVILHFSTIYGACLKTIQYLGSNNPVESYQIDIEYPMEDEEIVQVFLDSAQRVRSQGKTPVVAMFDSVLTFPGARFPWEKLVDICRKLGVMSLVDGAHGIGHIDLTHLGRVGPDFFISNCYKWLMVPRGCAVIYVPFRNQHLIQTTCPTSWGFQTTIDRAKLNKSEYFVKLFEKISTTDNTPYLCVPIALQFRKSHCGGESTVMSYCTKIAKDGGRKMAEIMGTETLTNVTGSLQQCCFVNVRLPVTLADLDAPDSKGLHIAKWMQEKTPAEYETYIPIKFYKGGFWCRISGQIYLTIDDFEWAAETLMDLCKRVKGGEWKTVSNMG
ncbi:hypothetical protein JX265_001031 [Neoarthrinium moseri]|uniref:Aminotransferase class V domain-containing protein n=1 Tax=Neoarthrinium moseri TaxID=1658444 RepID=A0A9P9WXD0_9PEZI|nr:uncharacterized protein JN550_004696 [Neoarthrinium moseri]KAI1843735.1 hypothetical protein JX266_009994 [Neoarthrinium moseri]KAI1871251.1 hypothetical protein JN550_004696 [Neoarthrinium moseri]KAI1880791.1 hypothetical protein JX265_001031 [Neoarthrinium moseri]